MKSDLANKNNEMTRAIYLNISIIIMHIVLQYA